jgi:hypothetical protein
MPDAIDRRSKDFIATDITQAMIGSHLSALAVYGRLSLLGR